MPQPTLPPWAIGPFERIDRANPVLSPRGETRFACPMRGEPVAWEANHVFNPAACVREGKVVLLYRAEDRSGDRIGTHTSRVGLAESSDGERFTRLEEPVLYPALDDQRATEWPGGCEDPRAVETEDGVYVLTYTQWDRSCARIGVATSGDLRTWTKHGPAFARAHGGRFADTWAKSGAIVTRLEGGRLLATRIAGRYWMYWGEADVWLASSSDLRAWEPLVDAEGELLPVMRTRRGSSDSVLVEPGPPAVLTEAGIVLLYNGKNSPTEGDPTYPPDTYVGHQALFAADDPARLLDRTEAPFFVPERPYERTGQYVAGTTFLEGLVPFGDRWLLYYGAADSHIAVASAPRR